MAYCYDPRRIGVHPPSTQAECALGLVRAAANMQAVCIDGGMYVGARAYLEINSAGHFLAHQMIEEKGSSVLWPGAKTTRWVMRDLSEETCKE